MSESIIVKGNKIQVIDHNGDKYLCLTDMAKEFGDDPNVMIASWLRRKDTIEYLGVWEKLHNPDFKPHDFEGFRNEAGSNRFNLSPQKWIESTNAKGLISKSGRYGGTYGHEDLAIHFGQWLSPEFSLYVTKEFKRLKEIESRRQSKDWQLNRTLAKINYRIHTDTIDQYLIPPKTENKNKSLWFIEEADILNLAMFGKKARQWKQENPNLEGNIRDFASQEQLLVLANLEVLNSHFVKEKMPKH